MPEAPGGPGADPAAPVPPAAAADPPATAPAPQATLQWLPYAFVPIWATGFVAARLGMPHSPPLSFLAWRFALSALCFTLWLAISRPRWPQRTDGGLDRQALIHVAVAGVMMHAGYLGGVWSAVKLGMGAGLVALLVGLQPLLTALWVQQRGQETVRRLQWLGLALGLAGVGLAVAGRLRQGEVNSANLSLAVLALAAITAGTLYQKRHVPAVDVRVAQAVQQSASWLVVLPLAALLEPQGLGFDVAAWPAPLQVAMAWSVGVLTLGGSSLLFALIARGAATRVTSLMYLVPPMTALMAWAAFGEPLTLSLAAGVALTALAVWMVHRGA